MAIPITKKIRDKYDRLFKEDPIKANTFLMFAKKQIVPVKLLSIIRKKLPRNR